MFHLIALVVGFPLVAFLLLVFGARRMSSRAVSLIGALPAGIGAVISLLIGLTFAASPPSGGSVTQVVWTWLRIGSLQPRIAFYLDPLAVIMMLVVAAVGFLILVYSTAFMKGDDGYGRFFAYMNLFIASMLILVLADNMLLLLLGWEAVGLCSYLLIGFWYRDPANGAAARKAFIVTRVGDTSLLVGILLLFTSLGTLDIQGAMAAAGRTWAPGSAVAVAAALLVLGGAVGKSAQLPLQTWLPDAMAGPSPVSALIHAATMVAAGVYLIARTHVLFELAPAARTAVAVIGAATLIYAAVAALAQWDIKRVLAYSTMSQIGYMFLGLGVGAWSGAIFHFMTHAFFKALLFLGAGVVIQNLSEDHDIAHMGGLRKTMPLVFWTFLAGAASLSAVPVVTAGWYSKDLILGLAFSSAQGNPAFWAIGVVGAFLTGLYSFRLVFLVFFGQSRKPPSAAPAARGAALGSEGAGTRPAHALGRATAVPLVILAVLSVGAGWIELPGQWGHLALVTDFLQPALGRPAAHVTGFGAGPGPQIIVSVAALAGIALAYLLFVKSRRRVWLGARAAAVRFANGGLGFDWLYDRTIVRPFVSAASAFRGDPVDRGFMGLGRFIRLLNLALSRSQTGRLRYYLAVAAAGIVILVLVGVMR